MNAWLLDNVPSKERLGLNAILFLVTMLNASAAALLWGNIKTSFAGLENENLPSALLTQLRYSHIRSIL